MLDFDINEPAAGTLAHADEALDRIAQHPFLERARAKQLTFEDCCRWIKCAGRESRSFPVILKNLLDMPLDDTTRRVVEANLNDELGNGDEGDAHFNHYLQLIAELGLSADDFAQYVMGPGLAAALTLAFSVSCGEPPVALGYMYVNELMTGPIYGAMKEALTTHRPPLRTPFFDLHVAVDEAHTLELAHAIQVQPEERHAAIRYGVDIGERGMANLLDEALGIFDDYRGILEQDLGLRDMRASTTGTA